MLRFFRKKMKSIMITVAVLFAASMFYGLGYQGIKGLREEKDKNSLAKVNGQEIDHNRYMRAVNSLYSKQETKLKPQETIIAQTVALNQVIDFTVMLQEANRKVRVSRKELDQVIRQIMDANKIAEIRQLKDALKRSGISYSDFRRNIKDEIAVSKMNSKIKSEVVIGPDDLREVSARHILIQPKYIYIDDEKRRKAENEKAELEARLKAEDVLNKLQKGQKFEALARQYSDDPGSKDKGGDLGYFITGDMATEFEQTAFSLKPGETSNIVKTKFGYHIIKVEDTKLRKVPTTEGKDISEYILAEKQQTAANRWFGGLRQKARIDITNDILKAYTMAMSGNVNEAVSLLQQTISEDMYNPYKHLLLAELYFQNKKIELAIFEYKKAAELESSNPDLLISLGNAYLSAKEEGIKPREGESFTKLAVEQFRKASLIAGENKEKHKELKDIFNKIGYSTDAANEAKELKRIEKKEKFEEDIKSRSTMEQQL